MQTADSTTKATLLSYFPKQIQVALSAYAAELNLGIWLRPLGSKRDSTLNVT